MFVRSRIPVAVAVAVTVSRGLVRSRKFSAAAAAGASKKHEELVTLSFDCTNSTVAVLTFNTPHNLNALTVETGEAFEKKIAELKDLDTSKLRCVVLTGTGKAFSAGGDLQFLAARGKDTPLGNTLAMRDFYRRYLSLRTLPVPVIAAINGPAIGAGFALSLACDVRIVADDARVGLTFAMLGIHPGMGSSHFLPYLIGHEKAAKLLLTGCVITGKEAHGLGVALESVPKDKVVSSALALAHQIASASPVAVRGTTRTLRMRAEVGLDQALQREADSQAHGYAMPDLIEGLEAVKAKRPPKF
jgi:enoyl-CoA hydratase